MAARKVDWMATERKLREALDGLRRACGGKLERASRSEMSAALFLISEILGEETGRGYPLDWAASAEPVRVVSVTCPRCNYQIEETL